MKTPLTLPSSFNPLIRFAALALALCGLLASSAQAAKSSGIAKALQGSYKVSTVKVIVNGMEQKNSKFAATTFTIGSKGLKALSGALVAKIFKAGGGGAGVIVTVTSSTATTATYTYSGLLGNNENLTILSGTGTGALKSSGLTITANLSAVKVGGTTPATDAITIVLKK